MAMIQKNEKLKTKNIHPTNKISTTILGRGSRLTQFLREN